MVGLAILGAVGVLLFVGALGHPVTSEGASPWWGPVSRWGITGALSAVAAATVFLVVLSALASALDARSDLRIGGQRPALFTQVDSAAVFAQLTGGD